VAIAPGHLALLLPRGGGEGESCISPAYQCLLSFSQHIAVNLDVGRGLQKYKTKLKPKKLATCDNE